MRCTDAQGKTHQLVGRAGSLRFLLAAVAVLLGALVFPAHTLAQFTTVSGTVTDPNGLPYALGTIASSIVASGTPRFSSNSQPYIQPIQATGLDLAGKFTVTLADNTQLTPGGSTWTFVVCSAQGTVSPSFGKGPQCFTVTGVTISGSSQDIGATLRAAATKLTVDFSGGGGTVTGSGTASRIPVWTSGSALGNSDITDAAGSQISTQSLTGGPFAFQVSSATSALCTNSGATFPIVNSNQGCQGIFSNMQPGASATGTAIAGLFSNTGNGAALTLQIGAAGITNNNANVTQSIGVYGECNPNIVATMTNCRGMFAFGFNNGVTTLSTNEGLVAQTETASGLTNTTDAGVHILSPAFLAGGTMTHHYGLLIDDQTAGGGGNPDSHGIKVNGGGIQTAAVAFGTLPTCNATNEGRMEAVNDSSTATWGATITGSSTNHVLAYCDGSAWTVAGK